MTNRPKQTAKKRNATPKIEVQEPEKKLIPTLEKPDDKQEKTDDKQLAYYSALIQAWVGTKMEKDKSLLTLSSLGLGLVGTILTTIGANSLFEIIAFGLIIVCFLITIISSILIFEDNSKVLLKEIQNVCENNNETSETKTLHNLDKIMFWSFIIGLIIFLFIGILSSYSKLNKGDRQNEQQTSQISTINSTNTVR